MLDKKKTPGKKSVYRLVNEKNFVDVGLMMFGGTQL
jgi:hypothetical protein